MGGSQPTRSLMRSLALFLLAAALWPASVPAQTGGGTLFTVDPQDDTVYQYDGSGVLTGSFALVDDNDHAHGLAARENAVYVLDRRDRRIYLYDAAGAFVAVSRELRRESGASLSTAVAAIALDGNDLWVADRGRDTLFRYSLEEAFDDGGPLSALQELGLADANARAEGLAIDETHLYVLDHIDRRVYRYSR